MKHGNKQNNLDATLHVVEIISVLNLETLNQLPVFTEEAAFAY